MKNKSTSEVWARLFKIIFNYTSGAEVARYLGISTSAINKMANLEELPEMKNYIKLF